MGQRIELGPLEALPVGEYAFPGPVRDKLVSAIVRGDKTSTSSLVEEWEREGEQLPEIGRLEVVADSEGRAACVTRNVSVEVARMADVSDDHAIAEGEGFHNAGEWRVVHERFWRSAEYIEAVGAPAIVIDDDTLVVCVSFEVIHRV